MQKILVIHSVEGNLQEFAKGIAEGLHSNGHQVDVLSTNEKGRPITFHPYDLIIVGSPTKGLFKGKIAEDLPPYLRDCKRTAGKEAMAFVTPKFFATNKAMKKLMGELEKLGCIVNNFRSLRNRREAVEFGKSIK